MTDEIKSGFVFSEATYARLKFMALIVLPALATFYFTFGNLWNLPKVDEIVGTVTAFDAFMGVILGVSTKNYNDSNVGKGTIQLTEHIVTNKTGLKLNVDPLDLVDKKSVNLEVLPPVEHES